MYINKEVNKLVEEFREMFKTIDGIIFPNQPIPISIVKPLIPKEIRKVLSFRKKQPKITNKIVFVAGYLPKRKGILGRVSGEEKYLILWKGCQQCLLAFIDSPRWKSSTTEEREEYFKAKLLGTVAHEVRHRVQWLLSTKLCDPEKILSDSNIPSRFKIISVSLLEKLAENKNRIRILPRLLTKLGKKEVFHRELDAYIVAGWCEIFWMEGIRDSFILAEVIRWGPEFFSRHNSKGMLD